MADEPNTYDTGEVRLASPIWRGRYSLSPSEGVTFDSTTVMLTKDNTVQFIGNATGVTSNVTFATLPEDCRPYSDIIIPVYCISTSVALTIDFDSNNVQLYAANLGSITSPFLIPLTVSKNGELTVPYSGTILLNGTEFHINDLYYR